MLKWSAGHGEGGNHGDVCGKRAYRLAEMVTVDAYWCCKHSPECRETVIDVHGWAQARERHYPEWPEVPIESVVYPLYLEM